MEKQKQRKFWEWQKVFLYVYDALAVNFSFIAVRYALSSSTSPIDFLRSFEVFLKWPLRFLFVTAAYILIFKVLQLYDSVWKYAGAHELFQVVIAVLVGGVLSTGIDRIGYALKLFEIANFSSRTYIGITITLIILVGGMRLLLRSFLRLEIKDADFTKKASEKRVMLVGAGSMGIIMADDLQSHGYRKGRPVVFVDDNINKQGKRVRGIPIRGGSENIPEIAKQYKVDEIILCMPAVRAERQIEILKIAMKTGCSLKKSPSLLEMSDQESALKKVRDVEVTDLLPRPEVKLDSKICEYLTDKVILVTGGGGSIGSELCRQVARYSPQKIIIFDNYENNAYTLKNQLDDEYKGDPATFIRIGSVQDEKRLQEVFEEFKPNVVFHAAAHKHVPLMEECPNEAVKNNIFGTWNTAKKAMDYGVERFIILSTDKAVNPTNVMGASKRVTEKIIQYMNKITTGTKFAAVRFGNVLGSHGSVIPIFETQIKRGGPVTVTDPAITRYFMTIPEAAQLVVQAGGLAEGGEVFVLDMGEPVKILSLAENVIRLSGLTPYVDIDIEFSGLRPGEKLYEELSLDEEMKNRRMTANNKIFVTSPIDFDEDELLATLEELRRAAPEDVRRLLKVIVPNYVENKREENCAD
ncbi:MAG: polysaccharide biosynthesis protein [Clostridiales bacterium]|nr:polysaccharide biosynthesis protein [Clostridiales bacterium]